MDCRSDGWKQSLAQTRCREMGGVTAFLFRVKAVVFTHRNKGYLESPFDQGVRHLCTFCGCATVGVLETLIKAVNTVLFA